MNPTISVIIPNFNGESTLKNCLDSVFASNGDNFEVIVVDDCSEDRSVDVIKQFPCRLIQLNKHCGASAARNAGARASRAASLFFTDSDCVLHKDTLDIAGQAIRAHGPNTVIGGTYQQQSFDNRFYSRFQSVFINYSETKNAKSPDYIATHAMAMDKNTFLSSGGFKEQWLPILEDVEYSHRIRRAGICLLVNPDILVQHIFNFSLKKSFFNAIRKSRYWTQYSISNQDFLSDSGTASYELKSNVILFYASLLCFALIPFSPALFAPLLLILAFTNLFISQHLLMAFYSAYGIRFSFSAALYYFCFYPIPVSIGGLIGLAAYFAKPSYQSMGA